MNHRIFSWHYAVALVFFATSVAAAPLDMPLLWTADVETYLESSAAVADVDGDGADEIVLAGREEIIMLEGDGSVAWRWHGPGRFMTVPAIWRGDDGVARIYAADISGQLSCLDGAGKLLWKHALAGPSSWSCPVVCDLTGDGVMEVVQTDETGTVWALDGLSGAVRWKGQVEGKPGHPAAADLDGDGQLEIGMISTEGLLFLLDAEGQVRWKKTLGGSSETWSTSAPVFFGASHGEGLIAAGCNEGRVFCFDALGARLWSAGVRGSVAPALSVGDFDADGQADIFAITQSGLVYRFNESGTVLWEIDMQGRTLSAGAIVDVNGDGAFEFVLSTQNGHLLALDQRGEFVFNYQFDNRTINVTPVFGGLTAETPGDEMVIAGGESGLVFCFGTPAAKKAQSQWATYRANPRRDGAWFGLQQEGGVAMTPQNLEPGQRCSGESIRFTIQNPTGQALRAEAHCERPDASRLAASTTVLGKTGVFELPITVTTPGAYQFSWRLLDASGKIILENERAVQMDPFLHDKVLALSALDALANVAPASDGFRRNLERRLAEAQALQDTAAPQGESLEASQHGRAELVKYARRGQALAPLLQQAAEMGGGVSLLPFEGALWDSRNVPDQLPEQARKAVRIQRTLVQDEHTSVSVGLFNVLDQSVHARVLQEDTEATVRLHRSFDVATSTGGRAWDPLPELDNAGVLTIPSQTTGELWMSVDTKGLEPGEHVVRLRVQALNGANVFASQSPQAVPPPECEVELTLTILPFTMAPSGDFRFCMWARYGEGVIEDLLDHGVNVFVAPQGAPKYNDAGALESVSFSGMDAITDRLVGHDVFLLLNGMPAGSGDVGSEGYMAGLGAYYEALVEHLAEKGIDKAHFALYPVDEAGIHGWHSVNRFIDFAKVVRAIDPEIKLYMDGNGELPTFEAMEPYVDVWCPMVGMLNEDSPVMQVVRRSAKNLWSYDCSYLYSRPVGANTKDIHLVGQMRTEALFALANGATGIGYWCYNIGENSWGRILLEYPMTYDGRKIPVTSRRWEAVREGVEEVRILNALRARLDDAGVAPELKERIRQLIEVDLPDLLNTSMAEVKRGLARYVLDAGLNEAHVQAFREEMLACVQAL
jgi:outer membrane protein assembly factor BamB